MKTKTHLVHAQRNPRLATRRTDSNPDHHLWNNNGTWWLYFTLRSTTGGSKRYRHPLKTHDVEVARAKRDRFFSAMHKPPAASPRKPWRRFSSAKPPQPIQQPQAPFL